ncbi:YncE family protein [Aurantiacibacter sp. D1-12]|uniref:YncE family protein n=1 Tax=Aurantiacibacter sp. D1-12 TaxID=2993658 RepID=UPI00237CB26F|nr:beta-propeller fold lactonase family protein [Aurantiacibacter sp. D1-12]MDE1468345.1 beta-propeller fold lactonase family protein [Aurantiacibacter sp. D1-12]
MRLATLIVAPVVLAACTSASPPQEPVPSDSVTGTMFVANKRGASLSRIDLATGEETQRADTCENPHELTVSPDESMVMVACYSGRSVQVYGTDDLVPVNEVELGERARVHAALWLDDGRVIAGAEGRGSFYVIEDSAGTPALTEIGGGGPGAHLVAVNADGSMAWGTIIPTGEVVRYDLSGASEATRVRIGDQIEALALSPDGETLWVSSNADSTAYRLDAMTLEVQAEVATGAVPIRLAMHPSGDFVVSSNYGTGDLSVIDTATNEVVRTIPVSDGSDAVQVTLVFSEDGSRLYAAETATDTIAEVDFASGEVLRRIATGPGGDGLAVID